MNEHNHIPIEDLLAKHLAGESSPEEKARIGDWVEADPANQQYYEHFQLIWRESLRIDQASQPTSGQSERVAELEEAAWEKLRHRMHSKRVGHSSSGSSLLSRFSDTQPWLRSGWYRVAAVLILLGSMVGIGYRYLSHENKPATLLATAGQTLTDTLSDGSRVTLNRHSSLSIPAGFGRKGRDLELHGEAFFQVRTEKDNPFRVRIKGALVTVLGTSFNIREKPERTEIIVESGLVLVSWRDRQTLVHPDQRLVLKGDSVLAVDTIRSGLYVYYRTREFKCDHTPLWQVAGALDDAFDVHIVIEDPALRELPLTATFHGDSLEHILTVITETFGIRPFRQGNTILLR